MFLDKIEVTKFQDSKINLNDEKNQINNRSLKSSRGNQGNSVSHFKLQSVNTPVINHHLDDIINNNSEDLLQNNKIFHDKVEEDNMNNSNSGSSLSSSDDGHSINERTNIIVNYLPQNMRQDELLQVFSPIGPIESCKLIRDKVTGQSLSYGFINFTNTIDAKTAIEKLNGLQIDNKIIKVSLARPSSDMIKGANLYVGSVPKVYDQGKLKDLFSSCGNIITCRVLTDSNGKSKGVAFIRYDKRREAEKAIEIFNNKILDDNSIPLVVKLANTPFNLLNPKTKSQHKPLSVSTNIINNKVEVPPVKISQHVPLKDVPRTVIFNQSPIPTIVWRGLYIDPIRPSISVANFSNSSKFINIKADGEFIYQRPTMSESLPSTIDLSGTCSFTNPQFAPSLPILPLNTLDSFNQSSLTAVLPVPCVPCSTQANTSLSEYNFRNWVVFVENLSPDTTDESVWQLFNPFGAVQSVLLSRESVNSPCSGFGFVHMVNYNEAVMATQCLNGKLIGDRVLYVNIQFY